MIPSIVRAVVTAQDPDNYGVMVALLGAAGGAGPTLAVQVMTQGSRDAVRGNFPALPLPGCHGLVAITSSDSRNGVWLGATSTQLQDASGHAPGRGGESHELHYSGGASWQGMDGTIVEEMPDGSRFTFGPSTYAPTRHTVDGNQKRQRTAFPLAQRVSKTPAPFPLALEHATGASVRVSSAGSVVTQAASGQTVTVSVAGGANVVVNADGSVTVTSPTAVTITAATAVVVSAPSILLGSGATQFVRLASGANATLVKAQ